MKYTDSLFLYKMMGVNEETMTGDVQGVSMPMGDVVQKRYREPDGKGPYGHPYFQVNDAETFSRVLEGRKKGQHWKKIIEDDEIRGWVSKNRLKAFYLKHNEVFIKIM